MKKNEKLYPALPTYDGVGVATIDILDAMIGHASIGVRLNDILRVRGPIDEREMHHQMTLFTIHHPRGNRPLLIVMDNEARLPFLESTSCGRYCGGAWEDNVKAHDLSGGQE